MTEAVKERCDTLFRQYELEPFKIVFVVASFAGFAGLVKWLRSPKGLRTVGALFCSVTTAAFVGIQVYFVVKALKLSPEVQFAVTGICGYSAGVVLDVLLPVGIKCIKSIIETVPKLFIHWAYLKLGIERDDNSESKEAQIDEQDEDLEGA